MRTQLRDLQEGEESASVDRLLARVSRPAGLTWELGRFDARSARSRIVTPVSTGEADAGDAEPSADLPGFLHFSLAGMQLKFSARAAGERLALPMKGELGDWIVKLPGRYTELPEVEHATMTWAAAIGLPVPARAVRQVAEIDGLSALVPAGVQAAFCVERFDRTPEGGRVHHEDFAQVFDLPPEARYGRFQRRRGRFGQR